MHTIRLDANSRRSRIRRKWCCPSSLFAFLPSTGDAVSVLWASSILTHDSRSHPYFIHREKWLVGDFFFKRKAKFNRSRTTWNRFDTDLREAIEETRIQKARRHDNQVIAKQWRAKGTARSTTQPSTVQANRWAVPPVYGQWRITRVFYSGQQVWTVQASDVACRSGNRLHASFFPSLKISNIFIFHTFLSLIKFSTFLFIKYLYRFILYFKLSFITFSYVTLNMTKIWKIFIRDNYYILYEL